jgi:hypothetical protein
VPVDLLGGPGDELLFALRTKDAMARWNHARGLRARSS